MKLHIFSREGKTFTFIGVTNVVTNESVVSFDYSAMSDGLAKHAVFFVSSIAGWSKEIG